MQSCTAKEHEIIDMLILKKTELACHIDYNVLMRLYRRDLIYFDVPIHASDRIIVPPLEGFVMNRTTGDYFETLLYKIFVSIDEHTTIAQLSTILEVDLELIKVRRRRLRDPLVRANVPTPRAECRIRLLPVGHRPQEGRRDGPV